MSLCNTNGCGACVEKLSILLADDDALSTTSSSRSRQNSWSRCLTVMFGLLSFDSFFRLLVVFLAGLLFRADWFDSLLCVRRACYLSVLLNNQSFCNFLASFYLLYGIYCLVFVMSSLMMACFSSALGDAIRIMSAGEVCANPSGGLRTLLLAAVKLPATSLNAKRKRWNFQPFLPLLRERGGAD